MKKILFTFAMIAGSYWAVNAQTDKHTSLPANANHATNPQTANQNPDEHMKFKETEHSFGTVPEGPSVSYDFEFENTGKEPIVLSNVQASCGCTTPTWPKEPITPGQKSKITATFNTQGRPGQINKTITVTSNVGTKILRITGMVEKAPESSVPSNNSSMMKR